MRDLFQGRNLKKIIIAVAVSLVAALAYFNGTHLASLVNSKTISFSRGKTQTVSEARENACLLTVCQDHDLEGVLRAVRSYEDRFNKNYKYEWVFLNHREFSNGFKVAVQNLVSGNVTFGVIPKAMWDIPDQVNRTLTNEHIDLLRSKKYGRAQADWPFRQMNRFYSGFFFNHPELKRFKYYWRVDYDSRILCDVKFDIFKRMRENDYKYGFFLTTKADKLVSDELLPSVEKFFDKHEGYIHPNAGSSFMNSNTTDYNLCYIYTTTVVGDFDFFRTLEYGQYFKHMDSTNNFFYKRWSDAAVISGAVSNLLDRKKIHWFEDMGAIHGNSDYHVPADYLNRGFRCLRREDNVFDWKPHSCLSIANAAFDFGLKGKPN